MSLDVWEILIQTNYRCKLSGVLNTCMDVKIADTS